VPVTEAHDRLGAALRALADLAVRTAADEADVVAAAVAVEKAHRVLAEAPRRARLHDSPFHPMSIVGGSAHPIAPQLHVSATEGGVAGTVALGPAYEGGPGLVHGGILSLLIDHTMGQALYVSGHAAMTVSLEVRYRAPTPIEVPLAVSARLDRVDGRKLHVVAEIAVNGAVTVEATGIFVALTAANVAEIFPAARVPSG
jgi:acyl-coenzyme A thioesterase PaaI-like protein